MYINRQPEALSSTYNCVVGKLHKMVDYFVNNHFWYVILSVLHSLSKTSFNGALRCALAWASYQIRKIAGCACAGNAGNVFPRRRFQRKPQVSDPGMHHGTCVTHVPWCMSGSLTCGDGENVPGIPGACAPAILRIWQEAHGVCKNKWMIYGSSSGTGEFIRGNGTALYLARSAQRHICEKQFLSLNQQV